MVIESLPKPNADAAILPAQAASAEDAAGVTVNANVSLRVSTNSSATPAAIGGAAARDRALLPAVNPATREFIANVFATLPAQIPTLVARAQDAGRAWAASPIATRRAALRRLHDAIAQRAHEIAETIARGMGKPLIEALWFDVAQVIETLDNCGARASDDLAGEPGTDAERAVGAGTVAPGSGLPVVLVIAPTSLPFQLAMTPAVRALAVGNAVIIKPSSSVPLVGALIERLFEEVFVEFPGLVQVVHGAGDLGALVATAAGIGVVVFSGSAAIGHKLQAALAPLQRQGVFDLSGINPLIVCDDAHLEHAANAAVFARFSNNGQSGAAVNQIYVQRAVADAFIHKVVHKVRALKSGPYTDPFCELGPLANGGRLEHLRSLLQGALDLRAQLLAGGFPPHVTGRNNGERFGAERQGWYWPPTVLTQVTPAMRVMQEEIAGPILPIQVVEEEREAIALANGAKPMRDVHIFSDDRARAERMAAQLESRSVAINGVFVSSAAQPLAAGRKSPPAANANGVESLGGSDLLSENKSLSFPYSAAKLRAIEQRLAELVAR